MPSYTNLHTKFIATLGPASMNYDVMRGLAQAGANIFRCNFAHQQYDKFIEIKAWLAQINQELNTQIEIQADIQGPSIRLGTLGEAGYFMQAGNDYCFVTGQADRSQIDPSEIPINHEDIHLFVQPEQDIIFMNGAIEGTITHVEGNKIWVHVKNSGTLKSHKSMNLPETELASALTDKDREDLQFVLEQGVDWIAVSFISNPEQLHEIREIIGDRPTKITSKIERRAAIENLESIIEASDALMVARGDLGIEIPMEQVPFIQKQIVGACHRVKKPVIVATQMMLSMSTSLRPTRAEVSDVANAVFDRTDAVMMSEETAEGIDPVNALSAMVRVVQATEEYIYHEPNYFTN